MKPENKVKNYNRLKKWRIKNESYYKAKEKERRERERRLYLQSHEYKVKQKIRILNERIKHYHKANALKEKQEYYISLLSKYDFNSTIGARQWRDVKGYEGLYKVSNYGEVYSYITNKQLKLVETTGGYLKVNLYRDGLRKGMKVHRLVAMSFISNNEHKPDINHIDSDVKNNSINNLEWVNKKENNQHATAVRYCNTIR